MIILAFVLYLHREIVLIKNESYSLTSEISNAVEVEQQDFSIRKNDLNHAIDKANLNTLIFTAGIFAFFTIFNIMIFLGIIGDLKDRLNGFDERFLLLHAYNLWTNASALRKVKLYDGSVEYYLLYLVKVREIKNNRPDSTWEAAKKISENIKKIEENKEDFELSREPENLFANIATFRTILFKISNDNSFSQKERDKCEEAYNKINEILLPIIKDKMLNHEKEKVRNSSFMRKIKPLLRGKDKK